MRYYIKKISKIVIGVLFIGLPLFSQAGKGTLVLDVKPFTSEIELKPKIREQLQTGGLEWGLRRGNWSLRL